jgi:hypothetical protein
MLDFPSSPTTGQIFTAPNGSTWAWDGAKWASTSTGTAYVPLSGGTMTGPLIQAADPVQPLGSATKQYVDATNIRYKNRIINGDMSVDQRNGGAQTTPTAGAYAIDKWKLNTTIASKGNVGQVAITSLLGYPFSLQWVTTAAYAVAAADFVFFRQSVEGCNFNDAAWGTANAQPVTLEFWAYSTLTGMFGGSLRNGAGNRCYVFTYAIPTANVWTKFRIAIPGDTTGTWNVAANADAVDLSFSIGTGATNSGTPGSWQAGGLVSASGAVSVVATLNAAFFITGVALMVGAAAANAEPEFRKYSDNLIDCQRYYCADLPAHAIATAVTVGQYLCANVNFPGTMRALPTVAMRANLTAPANCASPTADTINVLGFRALSSSTVASNTITAFDTTFTADADF